jgi:opacity protein-like surface antigen
MSGWYLRGDLGVGINQLSSGTYSFNGVIPDFGVPQREITQQAIVGLGAGYQFNAWFRADVTGEYRFGNKYHAVETYSSSPNCPTGVGYLCGDGYHGTIRSGVVLANGYVDLGTWYGITPYVGAGVGAAFNTMAGLVDTSITNPPGGGVAADKTTTQLAWAVMAGMSYSITPNLKLDFGYRYLDMGRVKSNPIICNTGAFGCPQEVQSFKLASHDIRLGIRYVTRPVRAVFRCADFLSVMFQRFGDHG